MAAASRFQHYVATVTAVSASLASVLTSVANDDVGCRSISLFVPATGNSGTVYVGGASGLTTTSYAFALVATGTMISIGGFDAGPVKLSDVYIVGTAGDKVYIGILPF